MPEVGTRFPRPRTAAPEERPAPALTTAARSHIYSGDVHKGKSTGWHYEPTGDPAQGTYILEHTRSSLDAHGVYEANVVIHGVKKNARSSFFPTHWTREQVEKAIEEAYRNLTPLEKGSKNIFKGTCSMGVEIQMELDGKGSIRTAYPIFSRAKP